GASDRLPQAPIPTGDAAALRGTPPPRQSPSVSAWEFTLPRASHLGHCGLVVRNLSVEGIRSYAATASSDRLSADSYQAPSVYGGRWLRRALLPAPDGRPTR